MRLAVAATLLVPVVLGGQTPPPRDTAAGRVGEGSASIGGQVTRASDGQPLRGVQIVAAGSGVSHPAAVTDANGQFELTGLQAGRCVLTASKEAYLTAQYGQHVVGSGLPRAVEVGEDGRVDGVALSLSKAGVITGRVIDERGNDVMGARVSLLRWRSDGSGPYLQPPAGR